MKKRMYVKGRVVGCGENGGGIWGVFKEEFPKVSKIFCHF
jgi:hypothetical protein